MQIATARVMEVKEIVENDNIFSLFKWQLGVSEIPPWEIPSKINEPITHNVTLPQFSKKQFSHPLNTQKGFEYIKSLIGCTCRVVSNLPEAISVTELPGKRHNSIPALDLAFEFNRIGLLHCRADLLLTRISKSHVIVGPSILEDVIGVVFYDKNVDLCRRRKKCFVYTIICSLLRERQIPIYLSAFGNLFLKSTITVTAKGIFAVNYTYLNSDDFVKDVAMSVKSKTNSTSAKLNAALCHLKSDLLPARKRFYPFLLETNDTPGESEKRIKRKREIKGGSNSDGAIAVKSKLDEPEVNTMPKDSAECDSWDESSP